VSLEPDSILNMATTTPRPTSSNPSNKDNQSLSSIASTPSARAVSFVIFAIIIGFILVLIVNSDKERITKEASASNKSQETTTTTAQVIENEESEEESTTTTAKPVSGTKDTSDVSVLVLNGSNIAGVAAKVTTSVADLDYQTLTAGNDSSKDKGTFVYYKSGFANDAKQLATNVVPGILKDLQITQTVKAAPFPASAPSQWDQDNLTSANIIIVVGNV